MAAQPRRSSRRSRQVLRGTLSQSARVSPMRLRAAAQCCAKLKGDGQRSQMHSSTGSVAGVAQTSSRVASCWTCVTRCACGTCVSSKGNWQAGGGLDSPGMVVRKVLPRRRVLWW